MPALIKNVHIGLTQQSCKLEFGGMLNGKMLFFS